MKAIIYKSPADISAALAEIGLAREPLDEVIARMCTARNSCTANHPLGAGGYMAWSEGSCRLREVGVLSPGWEKNDDDYIPSIFNRSLAIKVAVCNTDDGTGVESRLPQNRNKKGAGLDRAVGGNQFVMQGLLEAAVNVIPISKDPQGTLFWYLCVYSEGEEVRAELSCPLKCKGGFFKSFSKRIILICSDTNEDDGGVRRRAPEGPPEFDIVVARKA